MVTAYTAPQFPHSTWTPRLVSPRVNSEISSEHEHSN